ncbi:hypothetical protein FJSC11DRAFT_1017 [Fischerella thermalis JSC-11]|uniref:Uncharacterized protein n=1 Tax=Fischerella thermalis JSC-11 TaxID=741277 RepID=G6FQ70_9CYAN|nr:hypothetical protein FJSC11DRAFT_1017 [Fischerella thermalis JSC-11]
MSVQQILAVKKKTSSEYKALGKFIKSHFAVESKDIPFYIPQDLRLILLSQTTASNKLIHALASKYGINDLCGLLNCDRPLRASPTYNRAWNVVLTSCKREYTKPVVVEMLKQFADSKRH